MPRAPLNAELNAQFNHGVIMWPAWQQKKKKMKKKIFSLYHSSSRLKIPRTLPALWLNQASHGIAKGTIGCKIECTIQPWGQNEASFTTKKRKWKKIFFQHLSVPLAYTSQEDWLFSDWSRRLTEKPTASLDAELNALFNHRLRMRPAWPQKKKEMNYKVFLLYHSSSHLKITRTLPVLWLNKASHRNAKGTIACRIECSIQPWGQNQDSLTTKEKRKQKIDFFRIYQYHTVTVSTNIACFLVEQSVSQKCQRHQWMQNWMLYSTLRSEWGQLGKKNKKKWKKNFFVISQH